MTEHKVSQHVLDKKRQNRRQIIWSVALAVIIVLAMTFYDLKFRDYTTHVAPDIEFHYVASDEEIAHIPDDYTSLTIWQGTLVPQNDGSVKVEGTPVTPINLPQRQIDLSLGLTSLPANAQSALVKTIGDIIHRWESKSNLVMDALIDTTHLNDVPVERLQNLIMSLHQEYHDEYRYTLVIDPLDPNNIVLSSDKPSRTKLMWFIHSLSIRVTPENAAAAIAAADTLGYRFSVVVPAGTDINTFEADAAAKAKYFTHFIRGATPTAP